MSIETIKRKNGIRFRAVVRLEKRKVSKTFRRNVDAKQWQMKMGAMQDNVEPNHHRFQSASKITLNELSLRFEEEHCKVRNSASTQKMNRSLYNKYLRAPFGECGLGALSTQSVQAYFINLRTEKKVTNGRINRMRQLLHVMLNRAMAWKLITANPVSSIEKLPDGDPLSPDGIHFLSKMEEDKLLGWIRLNDPWLLPKVIVLIHTGIRYGEMAALRVQDVRLDAASPHIIIPRSRCRHSGGFVLPKSQRARTIPLAGGLIRFLTPIVIGRSAEAPLLWNDWEEGRWPTKSDKHFRRAIRESKVGAITIHDLRHTFAVRFLENGGHSFVLKELLGHRDLKTTMRYSHFSPAMAEQARGVVDYELPIPRPNVVDGEVPKTVSHESPTKHINPKDCDAVKSTSALLSSENV